MSTDPLVSVIIPTYNRANVVTEAIDSVLGQTYSNVELIVVDDGSTDDTQAQLARYGKRIRVLTQSNAGAAAARNTGIAAASGELIAFQDSDDLWLPEKLERQVHLLQSAGAATPCCLTNIKMRWFAKEITSFGVSWLRPSIGEGIWLNPDGILATRFVLFNQAVVIRRKVLEKIGGFDESIRFQEDYELPLRLSLEGPWAFIREPLVIWRESTGGSIYKDSQKQEICSRECMVEVFEKHLKRISERNAAPPMCKLVDGELRRARRLLKAAKLRGGASRVGAVAGSLLLRLERYRSSLFRRSPQFPMMKVKELAARALETKSNAVAAQSI